MLITLSAVLTAFFALRAASLALCPTPSSTDGLALLWSLITCPELDIVLQYIAPIILKLIATNLGIKEFNLFDLSKHAQDTSPIPLLDLLCGQDSRSLDLFKPVLAPALPFNAGCSLDTLGHLTPGISVNVWYLPSPISPTLLSERLETIELHYGAASAGSPQDVCSNTSVVPELVDDDSLTEATHVDVSTISTLNATASNNSSLAFPVVPIRPFTLSSLTIAATCVFLAVSITLAVLVVPSVIIVNSVEYEAVVHQLPGLLATDDAITTPKSDTHPSVGAQVSSSQYDTRFLMAPLHHIPTPMGCNTSVEIDFVDLQKPMNINQGVSAIISSAVISANGAISVPKSVSLQLEVADFNGEVIMNPLSISKLTHTEADRQTIPHEQSVSGGMWANALIPPPQTRTAPPEWPLSVCQPQHIPIPTYSIASGCRKIHYHANAPLSSPDLGEQSVADSMWANAPMPPPSPRTQATSSRRSSSVYQPQHAPKSIHQVKASGCTGRTEIIDYDNTSPAELGQREQSVADSMWANAPIPSSSPRTRTAPSWSSRSLSICQQHTPTSMCPIEASDCTALTEIIDCGNLRPPAGLSRREQSVAHSMWANAPMPPPGPRTRTTSPHRSSSICQLQHTPTPTRPIEASSCAARADIIDCGNPPPSLDQREQSIADSMWANAPMPPSPTRTAPRHRKRPNTCNAPAGPSVAKWAGSAVYHGRTPEGVANEEQLVDDIL